MRKCLTFFLGCGELAGSSPAYSTYSLKLLKFSSMIFIEILMLAIPIIGAISSLIGSKKPEHTELIYEIKEHEI